jgi:transposase
VPWREATVVSERGEFCRLAEAGNVPFTELCRRFGVSRPTGYRWLARWREQGEEGLGDRSRRPLRSPNQTPVAVEEEVCRLRLQHRRWGGRKISAVLARRGVPAVPAPSTVTGILRGRV